MLTCQYEALTQHEATGCLVEGELNSFRNDRSIFEKKNLEMAGMFGCLVSGRLVSKNCYKLLILLGQQ